MIQERVLGTNGATIFICVIAFSILGFNAVSVQIGKVTANPESYHLKYVELMGTVSDVRVLNPLLHGQGWSCAVVFQFLLHDDTGSIEVINGAPCQSDGSTMAQPAEGDVVSIVAQIQAPGYYAGQGLPIEGEIREKPRAIASVVRNKLK